MTETVSIIDIFNNLEGKWSLTRKIIDLDTNYTDKAEGETKFTRQSKDTLLYEESGTLFLSDSSVKLNFIRKYIYQLKDNTIHIFYNDGVSEGKLFQKLIPKENGFELIGSEHLCVSDVYNSIYSFFVKNEFNIEYTKKGPEDNLIIRTGFIRIL